MLNFKSWMVAGLSLLSFPSIALTGSWAEKCLTAMSLDEKIGQLFVAPAAPLREEDHWNDWQTLIKSYHIGNALLKASDPASQIEFLDKLQASAAVPLLVAADAEWGLGMRMSETISFPRNLTLGAIQDLSLLEKMGRSIGKQAAKVGIHLNLAPVADVNSNPLNPIIHMRSFGEDPTETAQRVQALIRGMRKEGLFACAKHFPGHGDTLLDSHEALPVLAHSLERLMKVEFPPFQQAIADEIECVMSGHLHFPSLDTWPTSLSARCMKDLLRDQLGFKGVTVSDALNMKALTNTWSVEEIALRAYESGTDLLLYGAHRKEDVDELMQDQIPRAYKALKQAFADGKFSEEELDQRVLSILKLKEKRLIAPSSSQLIDAESLALKRTLFREALTQRGELPSSAKGYLAIWGTESDWIVQKMREEGIEVICWDPRTKIYLNVPEGWVVGVHKAEKPSEGFGLEGQAKKILEKSSCALLFCTPYALQVLPEKHPALVAYENDPDAQEAAWDALKGDLVASGRLPVLRN